MAKETAKLGKARSETRFFHVTTRERLASIAEHGFDPAHSRTGNGLLYLAPDVSHALGYAAHHGDESQAVLLRVKGEDLDPAFLGPDDVDLPELAGDKWATYDWHRSVRASGQCTYSGIVPAERFVAMPCPDGVPEGTWSTLADLADRFAAEAAPSI